MTKDHLESEYKTQSAMCEKYNISIQAYTRRIKSGWPQKDALETPINRGLNNRFSELLGNQVTEHQDMKSLKQII